MSTCGYGEHGVIPSHDRPATGPLLVLVYLLLDLFLHGPACIVILLYLVPTCGYGEHGVIPSHDRLVAAMGACIPPP